MDDGVVVVVVVVMSLIGCVRMQVGRMEAAAFCVSTIDVICRKHEIVIQAIGMRRGAVAQISNALLA